MALVDLHTKVIERWFLLSLIYDKKCNHNYNKVLKSDWLSTVLISALIGQYAPSRARLNVFFFKQKTAYEIGVRLVGSEMCIRDSSGVQFGP